MQKSLSHANTPPPSTEVESLDPRTNVISSRMQPPPEGFTSIRVRGLVILSFWAVIVLLGLPTWWWTTSIHRARLPLEEMLDWADGKVSRHKQQPASGVDIAERLMNE